MAQIFPKWTNYVPTVAAVGGVLGLIGAVWFVWYYFSPEYTDVGYRPKQPVEYSHKIHAGDLGIDCRYCHTSVEKQARANVPPTRTCMNCHTLVKTESDKLELIRSSFTSGLPVKWVRVHNLPDFAYFNHSAHVNAGVGCVSCHGDVTEMAEITLAKPLSMSWCLDCHRNPDPNLRPVSEVTNMKWEQLAGHAEWVAEWELEKNIKPPTDCSACHR
ncbi:MAG: cytochrome c3 family protein [Candidatus Zixiibacteriota bacterium]